MIGRVHVSIHDVAPPFASEVEDALALARSSGARAALLVVPDYHRSAPLPRHPAFCRRLRELQAEGHEIFLHGYFHASDGPGRGLSGAFAQRVASAGEAEMVGLTEEETLERLDAGERVFREVGLRADGFVAPAWSLPRALLPFLAARACAYTEDHLHVYAPKDALRRASVVLNFASRTPLRLWSSIAYCRLAAPLSILSPARIAIHPPDVRSALLRGEVARLLTWARGRFVARARDLLA